MNAPQARDTLFQEIARIGHAVSNSHRLRLLNLLCQAEKDVESLAHLIGQSVASTSAHLKALRSAGLIIARRQGKHVYYRLAGESVERFWLALRQLGQELLPEVREVVRTYFEDRDSMLDLDEKQLADEVAAGRVILIDVRPQDEYAAGHIPGARSLPYERINDWVGCLPRRGRIVAYCRGPYCITAIDAVSQLRGFGLRAMRLPSGVAEWKAAGMPLETSTER